MPEREKPIDQEEARAIIAGLDALFPLLEQERLLAEREEEAILMGIEWAIRLRARIAQSREESGIASQFEAWLDDPEEQCAWLLTMDEWIFPEETRLVDTRRKSDACVTHLVLGAKRGGQEPSPELVRHLLDEWEGRFEPMNADVNPKTINAALKRRLFYYQRQVRLGLLPQQRHISEHRQEYEIHLGLHQGLNHLIDDGEFRDDDYYPPPLPF